jgi:hypothetical protein
MKPWKAPNPENCLRGQQKQDTSVQQLDTLVSAFQHAHIHEICISGCATLGIPLNQLYQQALCRNESGYHVRGH